MTRILPSNPSIEHLKHQAKDLLRAHRSGDPTCCATLRLLNRLAHASDSEILSADLKLNDAQFALAMSYGLSSWDALQSHVRSVSSQPTVPIVNRRDGEVWVHCIPKLRWPESGRCTFIGAMVVALNRMGDPVTYDELMGLSGAAFRLCFAHPRWDWSSIDGMLGYNHGQAVMDSLGYSYHVNSFHETDEARARILRSIDEGRPALGIDLTGVAEWGVIAGYADEGRTLLCRAYFGDVEGDDYFRGDRWPWINLVIGQRTGGPSPKESFVESLRIAGRIAVEDQWFTSGGGTQYARGLTALSTWADDLLEDPRFSEDDPEGHHAHANINHFIHESFLESRRCAVTYLRSHAELLDAPDRRRVLRAADLYAEAAARLEGMTGVIPCPDTLTPGCWTREMRESQSEGLRVVHGLEKSAIALLP